MVQRIQVPATWESLARLMDFSDEAERVLALSDEQSYVVRLVIEEIATNIIKYSYDGTPGVIQVSCECADDLLRLTIRDDGHPFGPEQWPEPDMGDTPETRMVGGLGLFLVRDMTDKLDYHHDEASGWNELIVTKARSDSHG